MSTQDDQTAFDAAFAEATGDAPVAVPVEPTPVPAAPEPAPAAVSEQPATVAPAVDAVTENPAPAAAPTEPAAPAPAPAPVDQAPAQPLSVDALAQALAELTARQQVQAPAQAPVEPPKAEPKFEDFLSDDEKAVLADYDKEWGEVSKAEQIRTKAAVNLALAQYDAKVNAKLAPVLDYIQQSSSATHEGAIQAAHPDVQQIAPDLQNWVANNPIAMIRKEGERIIKEGLANEVIDLITMFKQATGRTGAGPASTVASPAAQEPAAPAAPAPAAAPAPSAPAAVATAAVVDSKRAGIPQAKDMTDFESAWAEAVAAT